MTPYSVLVIKHGALGDMVIATAGFAAIRKRHPNAHIVCLTTRPYAEMLAASPYFNEIWVDSKPKLLDVSGRRRLKTMLRSHEWKWVYDLQTSTRSTAYQWLLRRPWPHISNVSRWSSHRYTDRTRHQKHALDNLKIQLGIAGITHIGMPDISWLKEATQAPGGAYALLVPGGAAHRPEKRWPAEHYAELAHILLQHQITPLLIGTKAEAHALGTIAAHVPEAMNLCGSTSLAQLATLARNAKLAVGNDTGPMHLIAASNCPSTVLFSHASDPIRSAPIGTAVSVLREEDLRNLSVDAVLTSLTGRL